MKNRKGSGEVDEKVRLDVTDSNSDDCYAEQGRAARDVQKGERTQCGDSYGFVSVEKKRNSVSRDHAAKQCEILDTDMREAIEPDLAGKSRESAVADNNVHTDISQHEGGVLRVQGKGGVLRVFLNKKADRLERLCSNNIYEQRSSAGATLREGNTDISVESRFSEQMPESEILPLKREKRRTKMQNRKTDSKLRDFTNSNIHKRELKDQLKEILINAGWTIDLRPRKGSKYVDSVYIPPKGRGSYWSITKAYAAYQEGLNRECNGKTKGAFERQSKASLGSAYNIPMDSLNVLKRNVVNKRKRKEAPEEVQSFEKKKSEKMFDTRRQPRIKETTEMPDELMGRKNLNSSLDLDSKTIVGFVAHNHFPIEKNKHRVCALLARRCYQDAEIEANDFVPYKWKRTVFSWMIDLGILSVNGKVKYMNQRNETKLKGWITRDGIKCICCTKIVSASKFELHAGSKLLKPSQNIYLVDRGISLLQCQLEAWKKHEELGQQGFCSVDVCGDHPHDDTCAMCGGGDGELICCNDCLSTSHLSCLGMEVLPHGVWHCKHCRCRFCGEICADATQKNNGIDSSLLSCNQCEAKYHQDCVVQPESVSSISSNPSSSFCTQSCKKVFEGLQKIWGTKNDLGAGFSWSIIRRFDENPSIYKLELHQMAECNLKIAIALAILDECFLPIVDQRSGFNLIHNAVYNCGSNFCRLNYSSFCTIILERGDEIISVASVRIHGTRFAEMPFIGTRNMYRRQGMCRRLLGGIESVLCSIDVEKLVIPTIPELKDAWTNVFGFKPLDGSQEQEVRSANILVFPGTDLLEKSLLKMLSPEKPTPIPGDAMVENDIKQQSNIVKCSGSATAEHNLHASCQAVVNCANVLQAKPAFEAEISTEQTPGLIREITMAASQERE
ncbi:increased DNA methylation 1-like [Zingiber officinale]|uniref:PHD-type domain-containing protein n=1 Tax=Zingiber officinale TaxID=94328 RepID=A0A8J5LIR2_ZINOF|nr:increased DNA methylation 1-like [Zingiber officinale]KAG6517008.1 hypothetical protein ZIOFF_020385 [Zingiber officinale]